jgi:hypothetical protein
MYCRTALRKQRGAAVVINHRGTVYRRHHHRWHRRPARDIVFRRRPHRDEGVSIRVEILIDILGRSGVLRLEAERRRVDLRGALTAQWVSTNRTGEQALRVRAGGHPFATLVDRTGDGYVEDLYVRRNR